VHRSEDGRMRVAESKASENGYTQNLITQGCELCVLVVVMVRGLRVEACFGREVERRSGVVGGEGRAAIFLPLIGSNFDECQGMDCRVRAHEYRHRKSY
jgi:hypothetical protein